ncbi:MAG: UDP-N-acetylmuramate dehydrogenase [Bacteroidota bacterium]
MPQLKTQQNLTSYNSFGIDAQARYFLELEHEVEAREFLIDNISNPLPLYILGGGSNILLTDDLDGVVLKNQILGKEIIEEDASHVYLRVGAGENWHEFVCYCLENNWGGIENLSLIPGTVGAAPIQNIGAYGVELKDVFVRLEAMDMRTGILKVFDKEACAFGYRDSIFKGAAKGKYLICRVILKLSKQHVLNTSYGALEAELEKIGGTANIQKLSEAVVRIRQSKLPDPALLGNAGSFFKNPLVSVQKFEELKLRFPDIPHYPQIDGVKLPAAWLIQSCGWKGKRFENYGVHEQQALVLVNYGGAKGRDLLSLSEQIQDSVQESFGIKLLREVNIW